MSEKVLLVHDRYATFDQIDKALRRAGLDTIAYATGDQFLYDWKNRRRVFQEVTSIFMHKDLGQNPDQAAGATCEDVLDSIRKDDLGVGWRTILCSGEYSYPGIRNESIFKYFADSGYDPTNAQRIREPGETIHVPFWVLGVVALGWVSDLEASTFRGVSLIESKKDLIERQAWIHTHRN